MRLIPTLVLASLSFTVPLSAQQPAAPQGPPPQPPFAADSAAVVGVVKNVFNGMRTRDTALMRAQFHPEAPMRSAAWGRGPNGPQAVIEADGIQDWLTGVAGAPAGTVLDERLGPPSVHIDGNLASVWVYYEFYVGDRFSHCGADLFSLGRTADGWKVIFVADSRRRTGCAQNLPKGS